MVTVPTPGPDSNAGELEIPRAGGMLDEELPVIRYTSQVRGSIRDDRVRDHPADDPVQVAPHHPFRLLRGAVRVDPGCESHQLPTGSQT